VPFHHDTRDGDMSAVVVTGLGAVSPFGPGVKAYWTGLTAGTCAIRPVTLIETEGFRCRIAAEVPDALPGSRRLSRADRLAQAAAREALDDAGLAPVDRRHAALVVGAVGGGMLEAEAWYWRTARSELRPLLAADRRALASVLPYSHAEAVGSRLGLYGPRETVVTACSSGAAALALAFDLVADGVVDVALAGGADALTRICFMGFNALRLLDPAPCRPFDRDRRGMSIGEGAAFAVLENAERARARGARVYAELAGYGMTTDAFHVTSPQPDGEGMVRAMRAALVRAAVPARLVGYVNAHGTATPQNDRIEARALREVFGEGALLVSASKSMIGHTMAAAGALEAVATVLALVHELVPPTANHVSPDPEVTFDCVPGVAREAAFECAISNSFGFGGQNLTLLFRRS
jgi:3-oxoacyl-[acyl-carrier-protein] synthase II